MIFSVKRIICITAIILSIVEMGTGQDRHNWNFLVDVETEYSNGNTDLLNLQSAFWTGSCYISDGVAATFSKGDIFIFDIKDNSEYWKKPTVTYKDYYTQLATSERPDNALKGPQLAYIGDNKILLGPGRFNGGYTSETWIYDLEDQVWTLMSNSSNPSSLSPSLHDYAMCHIAEDKVMLNGGKTQGSSLLNGYTYLYDLSDNTWSLISNSGTAGVDYPTPRLMHQATELGGEKAMIFGGSSSTSSGPLTSLDDTWVFNLSTNTWTKIAYGSNTPDPRFYHTLQKLSDDIAILYGGCQQHNSRDLHFGDLWQFNYDRTNNTGEWIDISIANDETFANNQDKNIDGESSVDWNKYFGRRRSTLNAFLGNDRILVHGGGMYPYYSTGNDVLSKTYVFDLGIPDIEITELIPIEGTNSITVKGLLESLTDRFGNTINSNTLEIGVVYNTTGDPSLLESSDGSQILTGYSDFSYTAGVYSDIEMQIDNLPPNTTIFVSLYCKSDLGVNYTEDLSITTNVGDHSVELNGTYTVNNSSSFQYDTEFDGVFAMDFWVKFPETGDLRISRENNNTADVTVEIISGVVTLTTRDLTLTPSTLSGTGDGSVIEDTDWHHIAISADNSTRTIFLDGKEIGSATGTFAALNSATDKIEIATLNSNSVYIEEFKVWSQTLTSEQIEEIRYQPIKYGAGNEVIGSVWGTSITGLDWAKLLIYYRCDYLNSTTPFSTSTLGLISATSTDREYDLINVDATSLTDYRTTTILPYANWKVSDGTDNEFDKDENWFSDMNPLDPNNSIQTVVINSSSDGFVPTFDNNISPSFHSFLIREGTKIAVPTNTTITIDKFINSLENNPTQDERFKFYNANFKLNGDITYKNSSN